MLVAHLEARPALASKLVICIIFAEYIYMCVCMFISRSFVLNTLNSSRLKEKSCNISERAAVCTACTLVVSDERQKAREYIRTCVYAGENYIALQVYKRTSKRVLRAAAC